MKKTNLILIALSLLLISCGVSKRGPIASLAPREVHILAINDPHAAVDNFPRFAYIVDSLRTIHPDLLLMCGGDIQTGNPVNDQYQPKGLPMIELMNAVGFNLSAVGNHEFDSSVEGFSLLSKHAKFGFLCANLVKPASPEFRIKPYEILTLPNGLRIAVLSLLDINQGGIPDTHPDNVKGFTFLDPVKTAFEYLHLRDSCDVFLMLNHYGFENDVELARKITHNKPHVIIGGHSHTKIDTEQIHNNILITQAERKLKYATIIDLLVQPNGTVERTAKLIDVGNKGNEKASIRAMVDKYNDNPRLNEKIAVAQDDFDSYEKVGYLMVDALRTAAKTDFAFINPGGVRTDFVAKGNISAKDVYLMDPFGNEMVLFKLTGHEIKAMHMGAFEMDERLPIYPSSGLHTRYTLNTDGSIQNVEFFTSDGKPLDMDKTYTVSMNNYMASVYKYKHNDPGQGLFRPTAESMIDYLKALKTIPSYREEKRVEMIKK